MRLVLRRWWVVCVCGIASICLASAQNELKAVRISKPPVIDGVINEDEWKEVPVVEGLHDANTGTPYADSGRFWLAYDRDFVYFAARLKESEPNRIRATEYRTNVGLSGDDYVELDLDLSGSMSAFNSFQINPQGATNIRIASGRAAKREWLGEFQAKARILADGWELEARIPWKSMDIPRGGRRNVRFNITRFVAKNVRTLTYIYVPVLQTGLTPTWVGVELPKPEVDRSIKLLPYTYVGYDVSTKGVFNAGVDMKTSLSDQINLVGSVNPDFRNVENQILSIDFSRFERLAGETRPFFQEGQQYSNSQLFASQRISGFDAGLNSYGRISDQTSFSVISASRFRHESDTVFNISQDPNPDTSFRFTMTDLERPGLSNEAYLLRYSQNYGAYNLFVRNMGSRDTQLGAGQQDDVDLTYSKAGVTFTGAWALADKAFNPRLGFIPEVDYKGLQYNLDYSRNFNHGGISDYELNVGQLSYNHIDNSFYRKDFSVFGNTTLRSGLNFMAAADWADFEGSQDSLFSVQLTYPRGNPYKMVSAHLDVGRQAGIRYRSMTVTSAYRATTKLQFTLRQQHVDYSGGSDQTIFTANYDLGRDRAISGRAVRQGNNYNAYVAYQRSGNLGIEYYLILGDPNALRYRNSLILKVAVPFAIGHEAIKPGAIPTVISK